MISLPAATEELVWGNSDCVLGHAVHEIGMSMLISKWSFITGLVWKCQPGDKTEFEGNISLDQRGGQSRHYLPTTHFLMLCGLTPQQDINAKKFNRTFSALPGGQVLLLAPQICQSNLTCCPLLLRETRHKTALLPKERIQLCSCPVRASYSQLTPFPTNALVLARLENSQRYLLDSLDLAKQDLLNKQHHSSVKTHCLSRKDLNQGRERLTSGGMGTNSCPKEPHRE